MKLLLVAVIILMFAVGLYMGINKLIDLFLNFIGRR